MSNEKQRWYPGDLTAFPNTCYRIYLYIYDSPEYGDCILTNVYHVETNCCSYTYYGWGTTLGEVEL